ncbi:hypothetical protein F441_09950 [Phytophthora nicotianae CJ01A1]|uniref:Uncharacterized protein n=3 Tax=Phytophthora nicotianae TaxID=4792 RepID=V9F3V7_PHYNI|nr:hypothetical protein F443_10004 [Phytophthora nicotianae P1569]ETM45196.1 hypothetical protein L914_09675 [Phytophthora nicotianae]ETP15209.1 hypothetical protein F441_09950 [Phytophthora nicotianae CJ01A1]
MSDDDISHANLLKSATASPAPSGYLEITATSRGRAETLQSHQAKLCQELLQSRLQQIELMERKLEKLAKYSAKLLNAHDELTTMISLEKEETTRIAAVAGVPIRSSKYVMSYSVVLEECCSSMLGHTQH